MSCWYAKEGRMLSKSKHNCLYVVIFIIMLTTWLGPYAGPSSCHKIYKEEKLYSVSHKI
jgi:cytochrome b561